MDQYKINTILIIVFTIFLVWTVCKLNKINKKYNGYNISNTINDPTNISKKTIIPNKRFNEINQTINGTSEEIKKILVKSKKGSNYISPDMYMGRTFGRINIPIKRMIY